MIELLTQLSLCMIILVLLSKLETFLSALLKRIKKYLNHKARILFYNAYIIPHLNYSSSIRGNCNTFIIASLLKLD